MIRCAMRALVATVLIGLCLASTAEGQAGGPWLVLPSMTVPDATWAEPAAKAFRRKLYDRGIEVWALDRASARFEENGSAAPTPVSDNTLEDWEGQSNDAILNLASGEYAEALAELDEAHQLSRSSPEVLNRDPKRAEKVLNTCLYLVRGLLETGSTSLGERLAQECRQLVLQGTPSPRMHPPHVLDALARVDEARAAQTGALHVASEPSGCAVRVNGLRLGETPFELSGLYPGRYRIQIECAENEVARVHMADVGSARVHLFVDTRFDSVVRTHPVLSLRYSNSSDGASHQFGDAERVTATVPAGAVVLIEELSPGVLRAQLLRGAPLELQAAVLVRTGPQGPTWADVTGAAAALIDGKCMDFTGRDPRTLPCSEPVDFQATRASVPDEVPEDRKPRLKQIAGLTLVGVGSASLLTGYVLLAPRKTAAENWGGGVVAGTPNTAEQQRWVTLGRAIFATSAGGATALVAALPLVLPPRPEPPWWAWLSGGLGVALATFSIAYGIKAPSEPSPGCLDPDLTSWEAADCVRRGEHVTLAVLTGATAAAALTVPLVYVFRKKREAVQPHVTLSRTAGLVGVRGRF